MAVAPAYSAEFWQGYDFQRLSGTSCLKACPYPTEQNKARWDWIAGYFARTTVDQWAQRGVTFTYWSKHR